MPRGAPVLATLATLLPLLPTPTLRPGLGRPAIRLLRAVGSIRALPALAPALGALLSLLWSLLVAALATAAARGVRRLGLLCARLLLAPLLRCLLIVALW